MDYNLIWQIILLGFGILIGAIIINALAGLIGITTWHTFIISIRELGLLKAMMNERIISILFLFVIYPALLGIISYALAKLLF